MTFAAKLSILRKPFHFIPLPLIIFCIAVLALARQSSPDTEHIITQAARQSEEYSAKFKDLTAEETKITEIFSPSGKLEQRRVIVSDFIVYESRLDQKDTFEYHNIREVDGKAIKDRQQRVMGLFEWLSKVKSVEKELERINRESYRYDLQFWMRGFTLNQGVALKEKHRHRYSFEVAGREIVDGTEMIIVRQQQTTGAPEAYKVSLPPEFRDPQPRWRGTLWLDARTFQIWREEREIIVRHPKSESPLTLVRYEQNYGPSDFGILAPRKFVFSFFTHFQNKSKPELLLHGRLTYTYTSFKRFQVTSEEKLDRPVTDKPPESRNP